MGGAKPENARTKASKSRCANLAVKISKCLNACSTKSSLIFLSVMAVLLLFVSIIMLAMSAVASEQALAKNFPQA